MAKSCNRTGFGRSYGKYRMGPNRIYGILRKITISRYRDLAPLPVKISMNQVSDEIIYVSIKE